MFVDKHISSTTSTGSSSSRHIAVCRQQLELSKADDLELSKGDDLELPKDDGLELSEDDEAWRGPELRALLSDKHTHAAAEAAWAWRWPGDDFRQWRPGRLAPMGHSPEILDAVLMTRCQGSVWLDTWQCHLAENGVRVGVACSALFSQ